MAQILNKQTDSRLNIISPATVLLCVGMRVRASASARLSVMPFPLSHRGRFYHSLIRFPALSLRPLDCIDHRWRACTRRKRLVYSSASYRYVNGESRSRRDHTCIRGPRVHFRTRLRLFETNPSSLSPSPPGFAKQFVTIESWRTFASAFSIFQRRREH